jgi:Flp pilus assembly protein TadG
MPTVTTFSAGGPATNRRRRNQRGSALVELSLLAPWFFFLFIGVVDMGFYTYDMIAVENATRVAAEYTGTGTTAAGDSSGACTRVLNELASLPNVGSLNNCNSAPLTVTAASGNGPDSHAATTVTVTYTSNQLIPIPLLMKGQLNVTRQVKVRVKP